MSEHATAPHLHAAGRISRVRHFTAAIAPLFAAVVVATLGCQPKAPATQSEQAVVTSRAREVLDALAAKDMPRLAALVHPALGVRFSPYAYVHADSDRVFNRAAVATLWTDTTEYSWGIADGTGDPIELTFPRYYARFVFNHDFTGAPQMAYTAAPIRSGNSPSNLSSVYPNARWLEYHFPGFDAKYSGMDWSSLWLVFQQAGERWFLVGVVHGQWTI